MPRTSAKLLSMLGLMIALLWVMQVPASAHAVVTEISPEADAVLGTAPARVDIKFNEPVSATGSGIRVFDPSGAQVSGIRAKVEGSDLFAELPNLPDVGSYTVSWRVISEDGHFINGAFLFSVGKPTLTQPLDIADGGAPTVPKVIKILGAILSWASLVALVGLAAVARRMKAFRKQMFVSVGGAVVGAALSLIGSLLSVEGDLGEAVGVTFETASGKATFAAFGVAVLSAVVIGVTLRSTDRFSDSSRRVVIGSALVTVVVMSLEGHALGLSPIPLSAAMTVLHIAAGVIWLGGLVWIERRSHIATVDELREDVGRRSTFAMVTVAILAVSGIVMFAVRMPLEDLVSSAYGLLGSAKIVLLAMALVLAWQNRSAMKPLAAEAVEPQATEVVEAESETVGADSASTSAALSASAPTLQDPGAAPRTSEGSDPAEEAALARAHRNAADLRRFRSSLRVETIVISLALVLGAVLAQTPPPGLDQNTGGYFGAKQPFGQGQVELTIDPGKRGVNEIHVTATTPDGKLMSGVENIKLSMALPEKDFGPLEPSLQIIASGHSYTFARIPFGGDWTMTVTATLDRFEELTATFEVPIGN